MSDPLSSNPALVDHLPGVLDFVLSKFLQGVDNQLPAVVLAYDRASNRAQVRPLIQMVRTTGDLVSRAEVMSVPVYRYGGGGSVQHFNLVAGNLGWIKANDRDISLFKQSYSEAPPNTKRKHDFADAMFYPDPMTGITLNSEDATNSVWQTLDAIVRIALWADRVKIGAPTTIITNQDGYTGVPGTVLDTQSTTAAFKVPRMTGGQRDAIPSPLGGMIVYITDTDPPKFSFYTDGIGWS